MAESLGMPTSRVGVMPGTTAAIPGTSFVEWGAIFAGGVMAAGLSFVFLTFGSAIGLTMTSPWTNAGASTKTLASLAVFWTLAQQIGAFLIGGYIAGRMRSRWAETNPDEIEFRDGLHGGLVWAVGVIIGAVIVFSAVGSVARTGAEVTGRATSATAANADLLSYQVDTLLRPTQTAPTPNGAAIGVNSELRAEMSRAFAKSLVNDSLAVTDRAFLSSVVTQRTGASQQEADRRVDTAFAEATRLTKQAADTARRTAVLAGFVAAASLLISLAAAWWAGIRGGHHRDNAIPARFFPLSARRSV